jgi:hypothetical protein
MRARAGEREREREIAPRMELLSPLALFKKQKRAVNKRRRKATPFFSFSERVHFFSPLWKAWSEPSLVLWYSRLSLLSPHSPAASPSCGLALELKLPPRSVLSGGKSEG